MRRKTFWIAASSILAMVGLLSVFSPGASPAGKEKVIYSFQGGSDGATPRSDLTFDGAGNLYGTTSQGGSAGSGTVFELKRSHDGWKERVLYSFTGGSDGGFPEGGLIFDERGNLYGTTGQGGSGDGGTVFKLTSDSHGAWTFSVIYSFNFGCCISPEGHLIFDGRGNLYGTFPMGGNYGRACAFQGCGLVFQLTSQADGSWTETTLHVFTGPPDGATPSSGVVLDSAGNIYGVTESGGTASCGIVYPLGLISGCGTIYKIAHNSGGTWMESVLYNVVRGGGFGIYPAGGLLFDNSQRMFGLTQAGGDGFGVVFQLQETQKKVWQQRDVHIFYGDPDGSRPAGRLVMDATGDLFGVTSNGGVSTNGLGIVFELERSKNGWREKILHSFAGSPDGASPEQGLVFGSGGYLYGTTPQGGSGTRCNGGCGTVYEVTP